MCNKCRNILTVNANINDYELLEVPKGKIYYYRNKKLICDNNYVSCVNCICGHDIAKRYYVYDKKNDNTYILGSSCIYNYDESKKGVFNDNIQIVEKLEELKKTLCKECGKSYNNIKKHNQSKRHIKNVEIIREQERINELKKKFRQCSRCCEYNILKTKPANYKYCYDCFVVKNEEYKKRINKMIKDIKRYY